MQLLRQAPYTVNPGDSFISKFWFDNGTIFGKASTEEMAISVLAYYPAKKILDLAPWSCVYNVPFPACNATLTSRTLASLTEVDRVFGKVPSQCQVKKEPATTTETPTGNVASMKNATSMGNDMVSGSMFISAVAAICFSLFF